MQQAAPLILDFSQEEAIARIVPRVPLLSSHSIEWEDIYVQHHCQPTWQTPEFCSIQHLILINRSQQTIGFRQIVSGCHQYGQLCDRDIIIIPANTRYQASWDRQMEFTLIVLEPTYIDRIADRSAELDNRQIVPHFAVTNPSIHLTGFLLKTELESQHADSDLQVNALKKLLAIELLRQYSICKEEAIDEFARDRIKRAIAYIDDNLADDLSLYKIANIARISPYYFARSFKQINGLTLNKYVTNRRMEKAKKLLHQQDLRVIEVARQVGIQSQSHFNKIFREYTGIVPKVYRKNR